MEVIVEVEGTFHAVASLGNMLALGIMLVLLWRYL
jgi:hypothetical protein